MFTEYKFVYQLTAHLVIGSQLGSWLRVLKYVGVGLVYIISRSSHKVGPVAVAIILDVGFYRVCDLSIVVYAQLLFHLYCAFSLPARFSYRLFCVPVFLREGCQVSFLNCLVFI